MDPSRVAAIICHAIVIICCGYLCSIVHKHISSKAPISKTIIDLIYQDCNVHIFLATSTLSGIFTLCLFSSDFTLSHTTAVVVSNIFYMILEIGAVEMTVSSILRLITLLKTSEEVGIQLFGTDDKAILIVRVVAAVAAVTVLVLANVAFETAPLSVDLLTRVSQISVKDILRRKPYTIFYLVLVIQAFASNVLTYAVRAER